MTAKRSDALKNRARLLGVARAMMQEGHQAPPFNELAKRAGVGVGTVYRHFEDHHALLAALVENQLQGLEALTARARAERDPMEALELLLRGVVALELDSPIVAQLLASPQPESREFAQQIAALVATAEQVLTRARKAKLIRPDFTANDLRRMVCGLELAIRSGDDRAGAAARYVDIVLAGLRLRT